MTALRFAQLRCQGNGCIMRYPREPMQDATAKRLRELAASVGWEVMRHTTGRDVCPRCRVREIETAARGQA